jgi:hypothetical protein
MRPKPGGMPRTINMAFDKLTAIGKQLLLAKLTVEKEEKAETEDVISTP